MEPDQLRSLGERLRREADRLTPGPVEAETRAVGDLFVAAASSDFAELGDIREVRRATHRLAELVEADLHPEEDTSAAPTT